MRLQAESGHGSGHMRDEMLAHQEREAVDEARRRRKQQPAGNMAARVDRVRLVKDDFHGSGIKREKSCRVGTAHRFDGSQGATSLPRRQAPDAVVKHPRDDFIMV